MANADLKSLFTSEDEYTVLELLNVLIDEVGKSMVKTAKISQDVDDGLLTLTVTLSDDSVVSSATNLNSLTDDEKETIRGLVNKIYALDDDTLTIDANILDIEGDAEFHGNTSFDGAPTCNSEATNDNELITKKYSDDLWATRKAQEEKCYQALKTVTKDFTRTDPVYVRIGEDGEPEIHYTMTQADGTSYFTFRTYVPAHLYIHSAKMLTTASRLCEAQDFDAITIDELPDGISFYRIFNGLYQSYHLKSIALSGVPKPTGSMDYAFNARVSLIECPAIDCENVTGLTYAFASCTSMTAMHMTNMKVSFDLSSCTKMSRDAILEVFNNLADLTGKTSATLTIGATLGAKITDEDRAIVTNKNWNLAE